MGQALSAVPQAETQPQTLLLVLVLGLLLLRLLQVWLCLL
jgi:hypothetical protein